MPGYVPGEVTVTLRSANATVSLRPLTAKKRSDGFWLFNSGRKGGKTFTKDANDNQLLVGLDAFGATQRMGKLSSDFVLVLGDNA